MTNKEIIANIRTDLIANGVRKQLATQTLAVSVANEALEQLIKDTDCFERSKYGIVGANAPYIIQPTDFIRPVYLHVADDSTVLLLVNSGKINGTATWTTSLTTFTVKDQYEEHIAERILEATDKIHITADQADVSNPNDVQIEGEILVVSSLADSVATVVRDDGNGTASTNIATGNTTSKLNWTRVSPRAIKEIEFREYNQMRRWTSDPTDNFVAVKGDRLYLRSSLSSATAYELRYTAHPESGSAALPLISVSTVANKALSPAIKPEFHRAIQHLATALALDRIPLKGVQADRAYRRYEAMKNQITDIVLNRELAGPVILNPEQVFYMTGTST